MAKTRTTTKSFLNRISPGPYTAEPLQADQGASIAICCKRKGKEDGYIIAVIHPENPEDEPDYDTAQRGPCDVANSQLFAASHSIYSALLEIVNADNTEDLDRRLASIRAARKLISDLETSEGTAV